MRGQGWRCNCLEVRTAGDPDDEDVVFTDLSPRILFGHLGHLGQMGTPVGRDAIATWLDDAVGQPTVDAGIPIPQGILPSSGYFMSILFSVVNFNRFVLCNLECQVCMHLVRLSCGLLGMLLICTPNSLASDKGLDEEPAGLVKGFTVEELVSAYEAGCSAVSSFDIVVNVKTTMMMLPGGVQNPPRSPTGVFPPWNRLQEPFLTFDGSYTFASFIRDRPNRFIEWDGTRFILTALPSPDLDISLSLFRLTTLLGPCLRWPRLDGRANL